MRAGRARHGLLMGWLLVGCGPESEALPGAAPPAVPQPEAVAPVALPSWGGVPWPPADPALAAGLRAAELDRDPSAPAIDDAWNHSDPRWRARGAWTLARIGGPIARDRISGWLADGRVALDAPTLGAVALLDAPGAGDESRDEAWDVLEDRLWTRYAVTEDAAQADALLLAVARVGGARS
ncbi:MAG: hypothetical protein K0V04_05225, partial [Deltaproteobacteria bacterium]|nr:hypothetical protein [Deltaproteobacteria bacterium]